MIPCISKSIFREFDEVFSLPSRHGSIDRNSQLFLNHLKAEICEHSLIDWCNILYIHSWSPEDEYQRCWWSPNFTSGATSWNLWLVEEPCWYCWQILDRHRCISIGVHVVQYCLCWYENLFIVMIMQKKMLGVIYNYKFPMKFTVLHWGNFLTIKFSVRR